MSYQPDSGTTLPASPTPGQNFFLTVAVNHGGVTLNPGRYVYNENGGTNPDWKAFAGGVSATPGGAGLQP